MELGKAFGGLAGWGIELRGSLQLHLVIGFEILVVYLCMIVPIVGRGGIMADGGLILK
jgi:hypothetical protein